MIRFLMILVLALAPGPAVAGGVFHRSYYSHTPVRSVQIGPRGVPRVGGVSVRSGGRRQISRIRGADGSVNQNFYFDSWVVW